MLRNQRKQYKKLLFQVFVKVLLNPYWSGNRKHPDPLPLLGICTFGLYSSIATKVCLVLTILIYGPANVVFFWDVLNSFDSKILIQYGPSTSSIIYALVAAVVALTSAAPVTELLRQLLDDCLNFPKLSPRTVEVMNRETYRVKCLLVVIMLVLPFTVYSYSPWTNHCPAEGILYAVRKWNYPIVSRLHLLTLMPFALCLLLGGFALVYIAMVLNVYCHRVIDAIVTVDSGFTSVAECLLLHNPRYQQVIADRLKFCIRKHQFIKIMMKNFNDIIGIPFLVLWFFSILSLVGLTFTRFPLTDSAPNYQPAPLSIFVTGGLMLFSLSYSGQILIDNSMEIFFATARIRWTSFDVKNRKMLMIFMEGAKRPCYIDGCIVVNNFDLLRLAMRIWIPLVTFLYQVAGPKYTY